MGDRTHITLEISKKSLPVAIDVFGCEPEVIFDCGLTVQAEWNEVDGGGIDECGRLAEKGIPHIVSWGHGDNYGAGMSACDGKVSYDVVTHFSAGTCVPIANDGFIDPADIEEVIEFYLTCEKVRKGESNERK